MRSPKIAITGGIGAGKSVVSKILRAEGFSVYDSDTEAKRLMDGSDDIIGRIKSEICEAAIVDGRIDRARLSREVFGNAAKLKRLNAIVHGAVRADFRQWCQDHAEERVLFIETALLYESGLSNDVDVEWRVEAPEQIRIERVMRRNHMAAEDVRKRIASQNQTIAADLKLSMIQTINNDGLCPILPQVHRLLAKVF